MISFRIAYDILIIQTLTLTPPMIPPAPEITPPCHTTPVFLVSHVPAYPLLPTATHCQASFAMNAAFYSETDNDWSTDRWRVALRWRCISWTIWIQFVEIVSQLHLSGGQSCFDHKWVIKAGILSRAGNELSQLTPAHIILTPVPGTWMINLLNIFRSKYFPAPGVWWCDGPVVKVWTCGLEGDHRMESFNCSELLRTAVKMSSILDVSNGWLVTVVSLIRDLSSVVVTRWAVQGWLHVYRGQLLEVKPFRMYS